MFFLLSAAFVRLTREVVVWFLSATVQHNYEHSLIRGSSAVQ